LPPIIDINLFVHNGANTVAAVIDSVIAQTWTEWRLTLIDDGSTDDSLGLLAAYASVDQRISLKRNRCRTGPVGAFQRGFWLGDADYVLPKSADDLLAPDFVAKAMDVLLTYPDCVMAHCGGLSFAGTGVVQFEYPHSHRLHAVGGDALARARHVMERYTSSPSFWGIYRRDAVDRLLPIAARAGWDHVLLAELALYGEIRHVPEALYWRRGVGRPIIDLARAATVEAARGLSLDDPIADPLWRVPCITTAYAHVEAFTLARLVPEFRDKLIRDTCDTFTRRWRARMLDELNDIRSHAQQMFGSALTATVTGRRLAYLQTSRLLTAANLLLPDCDLSAEWRLLSSISEARTTCIN
jgi:hypothetical protein